MGWLLPFFSLIVFPFATLAFDAEKGIDLSKTFSCEENYLPRNRCFITSPKEFTAAEKKKVIELLTDLSEEALPILKKVFGQDQKITIYRHRSGATHVSPITFRRNDKIAGWVPVTDKLQIHLTDLFFNNTKMINNKYNFQHYLLLHEMIHLLDKLTETPSQSQEFLNLYDWDQVSTGQSRSIGSVEIFEKRWQPQGIPYKEIDQVRAQISHLFKNKKGLEATALNLSYGQSHGHPTTYSMTNPFENFAEIITHHLIDPQSMATAPREVTAWLDQFLLSL